MKVLPKQPVLPKKLVEEALFSSYMYYVDPLHSDLIFHWGFDPSPEMGLPFCYRVTGFVEDTPPENMAQGADIVYSAAFMLNAVDKWCMGQSLAMIWPDCAHFTSALCQHLLLRAALGFDRHDWLYRFEALRGQLLLTLGVEDAGSFSLDQINTPDDHPFKIAVAYDLWRLGYFDGIESYLSARFGFRLIRSKLMLSP